MAWPSRSGLYRLILELNSVAFPWTAAEQGVSHCSREKWTETVAWGEAAPIEIQAWAKWIFKRSVPLPMSVLNPGYWGKYERWLMARQWSSESLGRISFCCKSEVGKLMPYKRCGLSLTPFISISHWDRWGFIFSIWATVNAQYRVFKVGFRQDKFVYIFVFSWPDMDDPGLKLSLCLYAMFVCDLFLTAYLQEPFFNSWMV